jgi:hypothetical protein
VIGLYQSHPRMKNIAVPHTRRAGCENGVNMREKKSICLKIKNYIYPLRVKRDNKIVDFLGKSARKLG